MSNKKLNSLKHFFDELDNNYVKKYKKEKKEKGKVTNGWRYRWELTEGIKELINGFDIENFKNIKVDIMGRDAPTMHRNKIGIFVLPTRHTTMMLDKDCNDYQILKKELDYKILSATENML